MGCGRDALESFGRTPPNQPTAKEAVMTTLADAAQAWLRAQAEAAILDTPEATARAEEARQALARHPATQHARRTHNGGVVGSIEGVERG